MKLKFTRSSIVAFVGLSLLFAGCGSKVARNADVSSGDYYSEEEFKELSEEQRDAYCAALEAELAKLESAKGADEAKAQAARDDLQRAQSEVSALESQYNDSKAGHDETQRQIEYYESLPKSYVVQNGDFLQKISGQETIYNDPAKWTRIYFANRDMLLEQGPNLIYPGWELAIPRDWPSAWTVRQDEYLGRIAGYWEIYDDATKWVRIYEANKEVVRDPDIIWPGWELTIPRD